jgi:hypothetical protein
MSSSSIAIPRAVCLSCARPQQQYASGPSLSLSDRALAQFDYKKTVLYQKFIMMTCN